MSCVICGAPTDRRRTCSAGCFAELSRRRMKGAGSPRWNGGRSTSGSGGRYVTVRAPSDYPFPQSVSRRGYIREHRMVMELHLGRALLRTEVVHHVNHDTRDNRIENLELVESQSRHLAEHFDEGLSRWPACIMGCGAEAKPHQGRRKLACWRCRRRFKGDPRTQAVEPWPRVGGAA